MDRAYLVGHAEFRHPSHKTGTSQKVHGGGGGGGGAEEAVDEFLGSGGTLGPISTPGGHTVKAYISEDVDPATARAVLVRHVELVDKYGVVPTIAVGREAQWRALEDSYGITRRHSQQITGEATADGRTFSPKPKPGEARPSIVGISDRVAQGRVDGTEGYGDLRAGMDSKRYAESTATHEFGHAVQFDRLRDMPARQRNKLTKMLEDEYIYPELEGKVRPNIPEMTSYGWSAGAELYAEAFTIKEYGNGTPAIDRILDFEAPA